MHWTTEFPSDIPGKGVLHWFCWTNIDHPEYTWSPPRQERFVNMARPGMIDRKTWDKWVSDGGVRSIAAILPPPIPDQITRL